MSDIICIIFAMESNDTIIKGTDTANLDCSDRAEFLKAIAHPIRLKILEELTKGVKCVSDFEEFLDVSQPNVSQHLAILRSHGIIDFYIDGRLRCYFLVEPLIPELIGLLKKDYPDTLPAPACCPVSKKGTYPGARKR